jgi:hypothetical protein
MNCGLGNTPIPGAGASIFQHWRAIHQNVFSYWTKVPLRNIINKSQWVRGFIEKPSLDERKILKRIFYTSKKAFLPLSKANPNEDLPIKRTSITLEDPVYEAGQQIAAKRGFGQSFSAYIAWLIQRDAEGGVTREDVIHGATATKPPRKTVKSAKAGVKPAKSAKPAKRPKAKK